MGVYKVGNTWYIDYYCDGLRIRESVGPMKTEAKAALEARKGEIRTGKFHLKNEKQIFFEKFSNEYIKYAKVNKRSWRRDVASLKHLEPYFKGLSLSKITPKHIEDYKRNRLKKVKPATINRELALLSFMFNLARKWNYTNENPVKEVKSFQEQKIVMKILDREEAERLIEASEDRLKPLIIIALNTGMRRGEILSLCWKDIDFIDHYIFIKKTKSGVTRKVPMNSLVAATLKGCKRKSEFIFYDPKTDGPLRIDKRFKTACKNAGISDLRFHDLRHTAATTLIMNGVDIVTVKEILGHSRIETTMRYSHPTPENKRKAVNVLATVFGQKVDTIRSYKENIIPVTSLFKNN